MRRVAVKHTNFLFLRHNRSYSLQSIPVIDKARKLVKLLEREGATVMTDKVEIEDYSDLNMGLGLRCIKKIKKFDVLCSIPEALCMTYESFVENVDISEAGLYVGLTNADLVFCTKLANLFSKLSNTRTQISISEIEPLTATEWYLDMFSESGNSLEHLPILWSEERLQALQGLSVGYFLNQRKCFISGLEDLNRQAGSTCWKGDGLVRALGVLQSRAFYVNKKTCLLPFIDFANHISSDSWEDGCIIVYSTVDSAYQLIACSDRQVGDQIFSSYGLKTLEDKFLFYGWVDKHTKSSSSKNSELYLSTKSQFNIIQRTENESFTTRIDLGSFQDIFIRCNISIPSQLTQLDALATPENRRKLYAVLSNNIENLTRKFKSFQNWNEPSLLNDNEYLCYLEMNSQRQLFQYFFGDNELLRYKECARSVPSYVTHSGPTSKRFSEVSDIVNVGQRNAKFKRLESFLKDFNENQILVTNNKAFCALV